MQDTDHDDRALIQSAFAIAAARGWGAVTVAQAARDAGLDLAQARARFPSRAAILLRFGALADRAALAQPITPDAPAREILFDLLMHRFDAMQPSRAGIDALLRALPFHPGTALLLAEATRRSMQWMLEAAGIGTSGPLGRLRVLGLVGVWADTTRAFVRDDNADLGNTMAALDRALGRAERAASWFGNSGITNQPIGDYPGSTSLNETEVIDLPPDTPG